ncbi:MULTISPECIES: helix-turn-helix transcriptional regulator [unclassified Breznakia]|uniref:helix-turn-helix domain-containing protein n=1 Tax=unclassified Breznakia TaxID=2623764 RepID=UPI0024771092|nr:MULTISPECIES: helix-turn-helix transcriptional regulator [unclassified Breznakia]MDH6367860.1 transcriptional regulator with XRE-family HTH domain [Breznakia sp. PH1-1]MDH6404948.1 transcriptional regulator with XRE-family HTH domain [Breznakia sp. PF1-11]MDH6412663.1 transcriptional regulator with XRE-family HTH domain [Breznakia sp. PFB1-11]MDH6415034.1 transcriptional regulator with XRE-family HTH domain [Breznakia sp. PFB1-14]MDH6417334.1 transcriptional regulator with XRE-family HTH do
MQIAKNLKYLRKRENLSYRSLALESQVKPMTIQRIENGTLDNPRIKEVTKLAQFFGVTIDEFIKMDLEKENVPVTGTNHERNK